MAPGLTVLRLLALPLALVGGLIAARIGGPDFTLATVAGVVAVFALAVRATLALVTDLDAGIEIGEGVGQAEVFAMFEQNIDRLKALLTRVIGGMPDPAGCTCATWMDGLELPFALP